ncbi:hypothetical protein AAFF_G00248960 [Aldrovandia affinis]|uniref:Uncharacterized protein n=1 Tax=Aldrovandia affinis TaxID=143900 RepID=A0AAD7RDD3_9TELE|nr:hypothetical protein AAFF_G00248960 [Aldrovandia affinis]
MLAGAANLCERVLAPLGCGYREPGRGPCAGTTEPPRFPKENPHKSLKSRRSLARSEAARARARDTCSDPCHSGTRQRVRGSAHPDTPAVSSSAARTNFV